VNDISLMFSVSADAPSETAPSLQPRGPSLMVDPSVERPAPASEVSNLPPSAPWSNHGRTLAAWTTVSIVVVGSAVAAIGILASLAWLFWVGMAVMVAGVLVGKVLQMVGYGQGGANTLSRQARARAAGSGH